MIPKEPNYSINEYTEQWKHYCQSRMNFIESKLYQIMNFTLYIFQSCLINTIISSIFMYSHKKYRLRIQFNVDSLCAPTRCEIIIVMNNTIITGRTNSYNCYCDTTILSIGDCAFTIQIKYLQIIKIHQMNFYCVSNVILFSLLVTTI